MTDGGQKTRPGGITAAFREPDAACKAAACGACEGRPRPEGLAGRGRRPILWQPLGRDSTRERSDTASVFAPGGGSSAVGRLRGAGLAGGCLPARGPALRAARRGGVARDGRWAGASALRAVRPPTEWRDRAGAGPTQEGRWRERSAWGASPLPYCLLRCGLG